MQLVTRQYRMMGTVIDVSFYAELQYADELFQQIFLQLHDYEKRFSANSDNSELTAITQKAGYSSVSVSPDVFELIKIGKYHSTQLHSHLNIAIGPLIKLWRIGFKNANLPSETAIQQTLPLVNPHKIYLDEQQCSVFLEQKGMQLDLGALAKGYFADKIMHYLKNQGITSAFINLGGNLLTMGPALHQEDGLWRIGIQDPKQPRGNNLFVLPIRDKSVVTSGIYERFFEKNGKQYHHIISSQTGYPIVNEVASLTIISDLSLDGEIWTTRLFGSDIRGIIGTLSTMDNLDGIVIDKENRIYKSF